MSAMRPSLAGVRTRAGVPLFTEPESTARSATRRSLFVFGALILAIPALAAAQPYVYPARGQSPQQQEFDRGQCYSWAVQQSGFDPANPQVYTGPPPTAGAPQGGLFRGAAGGAAMGAVGGAIGGDAGKGAAIGAAVGGLFGAIRRARWAEQEQQQQMSYAGAAAGRHGPGTRPTTTRPSAPA